MKKGLLLSVLLSICAFTYAGTELSTLSITLTTTKTDVIELNFGCVDAHPIYIDWGDGVPVETVEINDSLTVFGQNTMKPTTVTGTPKGGTIKVYADDILYFGADGQELTTIDVSAATRLGVLKVPSNKLEKLNLTKNTELYYVYVEENNLSALDVTKAPSLIYLTAQKNKISSIDLSKNPDLATLTLTDNLLTSIDISACEKMGVCRLGNNKLREIKVPSNGTNPTMLDVKNNYLKISTLPDKTTGMTSASRYTYVPQNPYPSPKEIAMGGTVDLSSELKAKGMSDKEETTTYTWRTKDGTLLVAGDDYTIQEAGIFKFTKAFTDSIYCIMTTDAFPKFVSPNFCKTNYAVVTDQPTITFTTTKTTDVDLLIGCSEGHSIYIDWGDGVPVETVEINDSLTVFGQNTMKPTTVTGTPKGGTIKVYASDILYFGADGQELTTIDVSAATRLGVLKVPSNKLEKLSLTKNTELYYVYAEENNLSALNVSYAPSLIYLTAQKNKISSIDLSKNPDLATLTLTDNLLTSIDISACEKMGVCRLGNNKLREIKVPSNGTNPTMLDVKNNYLKISTLPDKTTGMTSASRYTYVPQNPYPSPKEIAMGGTVDLSSELKAKGMSDKEETTTYTWRTKDGTLLVAGDDYTIQEAGIFKFTKAFTDSIYCIMTTDAFPKFVSPNFCKTNYAAVTDQPTITFTTTKTTDVDLLIGCSEGHKIFIDWGDGVPVETVEINDSLTVFGQATMKPTTVTGTPKGGTIKIYANDILYFGADEQELTTLDVSAATRLGVIKVPTNNLSELDLTNNTELYYVYAEENNLSALDVTKAPSLIYLTAQKNKISSIDLSKNPDLGNLNIGDNLLVSIDISACEKMGTCRLGNNLLEEIIVPSNGENPTMLDVKNNYLKISTLPDKTTGMTTASRYTYVPQAPYALPKDIDAGTIIDLSSELKAKGMSDKEETTTYTWRLKSSGTALQKGVDYTEEGGIFKFTGTEIADSVYCVMATDAFPKFTGTANMFKTTNVKITVPANVKENTLAGKIIATGAGMIKVLNTEIDDVIEVYALSGALITVRQASGNVEEIKVLPGSYVVKIGSDRRSVIVP